MKKSIIFLFIVLCAAMASADINVDKTEWKINYTIGSSSPSQVFRFNNTENASRQVSLIASLEGITVDFHSLSSFTINANDYKDVLVTLEVPSTISAGKNLGLIFISTNVLVNDPTISIEVNVTKPIVSECTTDGNCVSTKTCINNKCVPRCRVEPLSTDVERIFKKDSDTSTEKFYIYLSKGCEGEPVVFKSAEFTGTIQTDEGKKPVRISSSQLTSKEYGDEPAEFEVTYDVKGIDTKVYTPVLNILARRGDETISTAINFDIIVTNVVTPVTGSGTLSVPTYIVPTQVLVGESFEIRTDNVNSNIQPEIFLNQYLIGESVERKDSSWIWKGHINQTGMYEILIASMYNGGPIGQVYNAKINVIEQYGINPNGNLTFELHPSESEIINGDVVTVLIRDQNNIVADAVLYVNGVRDDDSSFVFETGKKYQLSATHPNYNTADKIIEVIKKVITISVSPSDIEEGESGMISLSGPDYERVNGSTTTYDGITVNSGTFAAGTIGNHIIRATADGYKDTELQIEVKPATIISQAPEDIQRNKESAIILSNSVSWAVDWNNNNKDKPESKRVAQGVTNQVLFTPDKNGVYQVSVRNKQIKNYELTGFEFKWQWYYWIILAVVVVIILIIVFGKGGGSKTSRIGYGLPGGENIVTPIG
jgi:hypothetical protein